MTHHRSFAPLLGLLAVCASAGAQDTFSLKRVWKVGDTDKYRVTFRMEGQNAVTGSARIEVMLATTEKVREVRTDGTVVLATTLDEGQILRNDIKVAVPGVGQTITTTQDKTGKVVRQEGGQGEMGRLLALVRLDALPDQSLKVGEEFRYEVPLGEDKAQKAIGILTLVGLEKKSEEVPFETLKVKSVLDTPLPDTEPPQTSHLEATALVEPGTGKPLKVEGALTGRLGAFGDAKLTFKRVRINKS